MKIIKKNIDINLIKALETEMIDKYGNHFNFSQEFLSLLISRNLTSVSMIDKFLDPKISDLKNPFIINDMHKAVLILKDAIHFKKKILIYGDKDVDGQTSVSLLKNILEDYGLEVEYYIPSKEGYGLHNSIVELLLSKNIDIIITVDCGITSAKEVEFIKQHNIAVIIIDHHEVINEMPNADAVVNPKVHSLEYDIDSDTSCLKSFSACGVTLYLGWAIHISYSQYFDKKFLALDIETTGLDTKGDKIIELGAVILQNGLVIKRFQSFINPLVEISAYITSINGITNDDVRDADDIYVVLDRAFNDLNLLEIDNIVVHNASFDLEFIKNIGDLKWNFFLDRVNVIDTLVLTRNLYPKISHKLQNLANYFRIGSKVFHRALEDAEVTANIYWKILMNEDYLINCYFHKYLPFATLSTISDIMPLLEDNRCIVKNGLMKLKNTDIKSLRMLVSDLLDINDDLSAKFIAWNISPILNSAGRMGSPQLGVEYLCSKNESDILVLKDEIVSLNKLRKSIQTRDQKTAEDILVKKKENNFYEINNKFIFVASDEIEKSVTGIVANTLMRKYNTISFVVSKNLETQDATGSARAPKGYNIVSILDQAKEYLTRFGGHKLAGGFNLKNSNVEAFELCLIEIFNNLEVKPIDEIEIDLTFNQNMTKKVLNELFLLEPFGEANPNPIILIENLEFDSFNFMGAGKEHFKGFLKTINSENIEVIGWNMKDKIKLNNPKLQFDFIANVEKNFYNGENSIRLNIIDILY